MPILKINNHKIFYNINGNKTPLVLLHDGFNNTNTWDAVRLRLAEYFTVIDYDRFGYGKSDKYTKHIEGDIIRLYSDELDSLADKLNIKEFHICGHCIGAAIALYYAYQNPKKVKKIVAESAGYYSDYKLLIKSDMTFQPFDMINKKLKEDLIKMNGLEYAEFFWSVLSSYKENYIMNENYNIIPIVKKINNQVLIINGDKDFYFDIDHAVNAFKNFKNAKIWIVPDTAHIPHIEKENDFINNVINFLT